MRERTASHDAVIRQFLVLSRWYLLKARISTDAAGRVSIEAPDASPAVPQAPPLIRPPEVRRDPWPVAHE